jgi:hypothetical protein
MGTVMLAAFLEWFLWLAAFLLLGQGLSESRALEHPAIGCSDDDTFTTLR